MQQITEHVNETGLLFGFSSNTLVIKEEDYLYPPESFLAEIGGSLGLFLGFSCYEYGKRLIDRIPNTCFQSRKSLANTAPNEKVV